MQYVYKSINNVKTIQNRYSVANDIYKNVVHLLMAVELADMFSVCIKVTCGWTVNISKASMVT